ncbi:hypothetical protein XccvBFoX4_gp72c [Xanthomonas phage FoX4]|uniref:Uncharacterized protein n=1 Tax=Xanthomonas phage FoX4 TaxID=2723900 RepID=A0A858XBI1_9CAUD|nr:hypothetical protein KNU97_gp72 [Xanthomonas phage FoX4]QJI53026.1 hypothetical protein XccvBFoX4_gp72c [Xanthomonas phage FoX4]
MRAWRCRRPAWRCSARYGATLTRGGPYFGNVAVPQRLLERPSEISASARLPEPAYFKRSAGSAAALT